VLEALERVSAFDGEITLIVGAGSSVEADLPSWDELVRALVTQSGEDLGLRGEELGEWVTAIESEGLLAGGAVAKALAGNEDAFRDRLRSALYRGQPATAYLPQALAQQVAWVKAKLGSAVTVVTANYDGLLEQAMREAGLNVHSYVRWRHEPTGSAAVYHLHGRLMPRYPATGRLVLSEDDYARVQDPGTWQERFMREALERTLCLFVGLSLRDPNLIRWLYRYANGQQSRRHLAMFVRQASPEVSPGVRPRLEHATRERWGRCGVDVVWADFFGEVAQFLHEVTLQRMSSSLPGFVERAEDHLEAGRTFLVPSSVKLFRQVQDRVSAFLACRTGSGNRYQRRSGPQHGAAWTWAVGCRPFFWHCGPMGNI
jgi:hypothetical protein